MTFLSEQFARIPKPEKGGSIHISIWQADGETHFSASCSHDMGRGATPEAAVEAAVAQYLDSCKIIAEERARASHSRKPVDKPWNYGKTEGCGPTARPTNPHPDSTAGRKR